MDSPSDFPMPDPLDAIEKSIEQPLSWPDQPSYPGELLGSLEASVEQPIAPPRDAYADPISRMLDALEASVEGQKLQGSGFVHDPLHDILDRLEKEIEGACIKPPPEQEDPPEPPTEESYGCYESKPPVQDTQMSLIRQYPPTFQRIQGSRTGIRGTSSRSEYYCCLHDSWVCQVDCVSCSDFEQAETQADEGVELCIRSSEYLDSL